VSRRREEECSYVVYLGEVYRFTSTIAYDCKSQAPGFISVHNLYGLMIKQVVREPTKKQETYSSGMGHLHKAPAGREIAAAVL